MKAYSCFTCARYRKKGDLRVILPVSGWFEPNSWVQIVEGLTLTAHAELEELVVDLMRQSKVPGLSIGVVVDGKPSYARAFGARNLEKNLPMTPDTLWVIASISKSFCAMAVMHLARA